MILIETIKLSNMNIQVVKAKKAVGKKAFLKDGYKQCLNDNYLESNDKIVHYNDYMKGWLVEDKRMVT